MLTELTAEDVRHLLARMQKHARAHMLRHLGMKDMSRVGPSLGMQVLNGLRRLRPLDALSLSLHLARPVQEELVTDLVSPGVSDARPASSRWSGAQRRWALWAAMASSAFDARVLLHAARYDWWLPPGVPTDEGDALLATAQAVVAATPDFSFDSAFTVPSAGHTAPDATEQPEAGEQTTLEEGTRNMSDSVHLPDEAADVRNGLAKALSEARQSAERIRTVLQDGFVPAPADLAPLGALTKKLDEAKAWLAARSVILPEESVPAALKAISTVEDSWVTTGERARLAALTGLTHVTGPGEFRSELDGLAALVETLLAAPDWDGEQRELVESLLALGKLVELAASEGGSAAADAALLAQCYTRAGTLPRELAVLTGLATAGQLVQGPTRHPGTSAQSAPTATEPSAEPVMGHTSDHDEEPAAVAASSANDVRSPAVVPEAHGTAPSEPDGDLEGSVAGKPAEEPGLGRAVTPPVQEAERTPAEAPSQVDIGVAALLAQGRFGMAHAVARAAGWPEPRLWALRVAALAQAVRSDTGACAARLRVELADGDLQPEPLTQLLTVPALLRTALITGEYAAGALLVTASTRVEQCLGKVASEVGERALRGTLLEAPLIGVLADVSELERRIAAAGEAARVRLHSSRKMPLQRATEMANEWLKPIKGLLGTLLTAAEQDDRAALDRVAAEVRRLSQPDEVVKELDKLDHRHIRASSGKPVEGLARRNLLGLMTESLMVVSEWTEAVTALNRQMAGGRAWATEEIATMRATIRECEKGVLAGLAAQSAGTDNPLVAAAAEAASRSMKEIFDLLEGDTKLPLGEVPADLALTAELLKVPGATLDPQIFLTEVPDGSTPEILLDAAAMGWIAAFDAQLGVENYPVAKQMIELAKKGWLPAHGGESDLLARPQSLDALTSAEARTRSKLTAERARLLDELGHARARNEISDEQESDLAEALRLADPALRQDLHQVRLALRQAAVNLSSSREEAARRMRDRLRALSDRPDLAEADLERVRRLIDEGELATAEEHIYLLDNGEQMPVPTEQRDLERFFPAVPEALADGITKKFLATVRAGGRYAGFDALDYSGLSPDGRGNAAGALELWAKLGQTRPEERANISQRDLLPVMRLLGIEAERAERRDDLRRDRARRFIELTGVSVIGKALVPAFGTKLGIGDRRGGRLRVLLVWDRPTADLLMGWVDQDTSGDGVLVAHFGTMPPAVRRRLAARAVASGAPVVVVDDAVLAYAVANGSSHLEVTMALTLPFSSVNPYVRHKRMLVAPEMFYGRDKERRSILNPDGTQVIFGGRGLGKSALLRESKDRFEREPARVAVHLELNITSIEGGGLGAGAVWDRLRETLRTAGVLPPPKPKSRRDAHAAVREGVLDWLRHDSRRRLLILLDESDGFFESDAPGFHETNRLKELCLETKGHAKVVFAGLHSVQRFTKLNGNGPFRHLGQPTVIGPLSPQHAFDLITTPLGALGFVFADPDLVHRILNHCSYQPFLLQMFGHRLVDTMHAKRLKGQDGPPYTITAEDVEAVESDPDLRRDMISAFRDTLNLDPRYNVIANVLAHHAYENTMDTRLSDAQLADECRFWWHEGFAKLDPESFRSYLQELAGLGVLRPNNDGVGWRLRSSNALRMIGSRDEVTAELVRADSESVPPEFIAQQTRRTLRDGTRWPLTIAQVNDLLGDHVNQVRLVLGSAATGIHTVRVTLSEVVKDLGDRFDIIVAGGRKQFTDALTGGIPGQRRVVVSDFPYIGTKPEGCWEGLRAAIESRPQRSGVTRAVVLIADPATMPFWMRVLAQDLPELGVVTLRRHDRRTLKVWSVETGRFGNEHDRDRLLAVTSGWPYLVEKAFTQCTDTESEDEALRRLSAELDSPQGLADLVELVGLTADESLAAVFTELRTLMEAEGLPFGDLVTAAGLTGACPDPAAAVRCLEALGVFDRDADGAYRLDPLLYRAWPSRRPHLG
ncbi:hypothetical protein DQ384_04370 [Sphaerisporangium album]|uniref:Uncharacterized protein n=1 Tax=Sphaerisporangium album TaxID=509200 RepID=A0A367FS39_9ACTN|nr:hypothetical protein DQ384_04370 [Sphaerisporangium album]